MFGLRLAKTLGRKGRSVLFVCLAAVTLSFALSLTINVPVQAMSPYGMVDPIAENQAVGYEIYVERCATCHVALPPAVLPAEAWKTIITDRAHYGVSLPTIPPFDQQLMVNYLQTYSRSYQNRGPTPYRLSDSDYFSALHPNMTLPEPLNLRSCVGCHIGAAEQDYSGAVAPNDS